MTTTEKPHNSIDGESLAEHLAYCGGIQDAFNKGHAAGFREGYRAAIAAMQKAEGPLH